ncbi:MULTISPECIES: hypothetical protein [Bacteria]|uniref:hypothetical protein n=1 Tax=Bacteria TaxID=2 RepID=UPI003C7E435E
MTDATSAEGATEGQEPERPAGGQEQPQDGQETPQAPQEPADGEKRGGNAEAAKYRTQLRTAEATIADHEAHIAELQQFVIAGLISDRVADPKVFAKLVDREAWAGDDGRIDLNRLDDAVQQLLTDHPSLKPAGKPTPRTAPRPGKGTPVAGGPAPSSLSAIDKAFPKSGATMRNLLERDPESGTVGDTLQRRGKPTRIRAKIGGEDE